MADVVIAAVFGFAGAFIPKTGIDAKQVAGKGKTIGLHIKNAISSARRNMYKRKRTELFLHVLTHTGFYVASTAGSSIGSYLVTNHIGAYYYGI